MIRAVSLDLFDTLVDLSMDGLPRLRVGGRELPTTAGPLHAALSERAPTSLEDFLEALRAVDRSQSAIRYGEGREVSTEQRFREVLERLGIEDAALVDVLTGVHMGLLREQVDVPVHHCSVLSGLRGRVRIGVCSNFTHARTAHDILEEARLRPHLDAVVISDEVGVRKPRGEIFDALLERLGVGPEETLHVGDNLDADVAGAAARGMPTAWLTRRVPDAARVLERHRGPKPDWVLSDLEELDAIL